MTDQLAFFGALGDKPARDAISTELDATLFVEAGAGTGKTKALVDRVVALVTSDGPDLPAPMRAIAAITFTEKAAAELRDRIRAELRKLAADDERAPDSFERVCRAALDDLDAAAICTLALVRAAHPHRVPDRDRAAAADRGPRRDLVADRVRGTLAGVRRRVARRSRARVRRCSCCSPRA